MPSAVRFSSRWPRKRESLKTAVQNDGEYPGIKDLVPPKLVGSIWNNFQESLLDAYKALQPCSSLVELHVGSNQSSFNWFPEESPAIEPISEEFDASCEAEEFFWQELTEEELSQRTG